MRHLVRLVRMRLASRPDSEHVMSVNRLAFCLCFLLYLAIGRPPHYVQGLGVIAVGMTVTIAIFVHIVIWPGANPARRAFAMFADLFVICYEMHLGSSVNGIFYPLVLWTVIGNGLRFGLRSLFSATLLGVAGFGLMAATTPFWQQHIALSVGLALGLVLVPVYAGILLKSLSAAKLQAEAANQAKTVFLAGISHELRTPLHAITGNASLLQGTELSTDQADMTHAVMTASQTLLLLIDDLMHYSKIEAGALEFELGDFALLPVLSNVRSILLTGAQSKGLRLAVNVDPRTPILLHGDERRVQEILLNLAGNAIKFTSFGGVLIGVQPVMPAANGAGLRLRFEVTDTGIGIPAEAHERIFERFTQADETINTRFGGTGLGLTICKRLVEKMGGAIGVQSQPGSGSTFWFDLPFASGQPGEAAGTPGTAPHLVTIGLEAGLQARAAELETAGIRSLAFGTADLPELLNESAAPDGPVLIAAALPAQAERLLAAMRAHPATRPPAVIVVAAEATLAADMRWVAPTLLPPDADAALLAGAIRIARTLAEGRDRVPAETAPEAVVQRRRFRILVADDNVLNRKVMARILDSGNHIHRIVGNGQEALDALEEETYDLVLMDMNMPVMNGIEATKLYRFMSLGQKHMPIVGLTADATDEAKALCREAGMDRSLVKPVTAEALLQVIEETVALEAEPDEAIQAESPTPVISELPPPQPEFQLQPRSAAGVLHPGVSRLRAVTAVVLDTNQLVDLRSLGGDGFVRDLLETFMCDANELIDGLADAQARGNLPDFHSNAHALASGGANVGSVLVNKLGLAMEKFSRSDMTTLGIAKIAEARRELARFEAEAAGFLSGPAPAFSPLDRRSTSA